MRTFKAALLALLLLPIAADSVTVRKMLIENFDGTYSTTWPNGNKPQPGACSTWTCDAIGDAVADISESSPTQLTFTCSGSSDHGSVCRASQPIGTSSDAEINVNVPAIASWAGHTEDFTSVGVGIGEDGDPAYWAQCFWPFASSGTRFKTGTGDTVATISIGDSAQESPQLVRLQYDVSDAEIDCFDSDNGSTYNQVGDTVDKNLDCAPDCVAYVFLTSHDATLSTTVTPTGASVSTTLTGGGGPGDPGARSLEWEGDLESGQIRDKDESHDGFFLKTLLPKGDTSHTECASQATSTKDCEGGTTTVYIKECGVAQGGAAAGTNLDTKVVTGDFPLGPGSPAAVAPRGGIYYVKSAIYFDDREYCEFQGNSGKNKPRMNLEVGSFPYDYDVEIWVGFSIHLPENLEHETGKKGRNGKNMLANSAAPGADTIWSLNYWVPSGVEDGCASSNQSHWVFLLHTNDASTAEQGALQEQICVQSTATDEGLWTDWIIRFRVNPFASGEGYPCPVNPVDDLSIAGAQDQDFACDVGIMQVWKSVGDPDENGDRPMRRVLNRVNQPIGLVPAAGGQMDFSFRQYKHGWHQNPTDVAGPVWIGHDEMRYGLGASGTDFQDVHPTQKICAEIAETPGHCP